MNTKAPSHGHLSQAPSHSCKLTQEARWLTEQRTPTHLSSNPDIKSLKMVTFRFGSPVKLPSPISLSVRVHAQQLKAQDSLQNRSTVNLLLAKQTIGIV